MIPPADPKRLSPARHETARSRPSNSLSPAGLAKLVIPGLGGAESPESMNTGLWKMDSRLAACGVAPE